jgi:PGAP1-like protein
VVMFIISSLCVFLSVVSTRIIRSSRNTCSDTYSYPIYDRINITLNGTPSCYKLYRFFNRQVHQRISKTAVIFLPGSRGNYAQVRSLGSILIDRSDEPPDVYTLDLCEDLSVLSGYTINTQVNFLAEVISFLVSNPNYYLSRGSDLHIVLIGHSMGGVVSGVYSKRLYPGTFSLSVVSLASQHSAPLFYFDPLMSSLYSELRKPDTENNDVAYISVSSGERDTLVWEPATNPSVLVSRASPGSSLWIKSASTQTMAAIPADHQCIMWCNQIISVLADAILNVHKKCSIGHACSSVKRIKEFKSVVYPKGMRQDNVMEDNTKISTILKLISAVFLGVAVPSEMSMYSYLALFWWNFGQSVFVFLTFIALSGLVRNNLDVEKKISLSSLMDLQASLSPLVFPISFISKKVLLQSFTTIWLFRFDVIASVCFLAYYLVDQTSKSSVFPPLIPSIVSFIMALSITVVIYFTHNVLHRPFSSRKKLFSLHYCLLAFLSVWLVAVGVSLYLISLKDLDSERILAISLYTSIPVLWVVTIIQHFLHGESEIAFYLYLYLFSILPQSAGFILHFHQVIFKRVPFNYTSLMYVIGYYSSFYVAHLYVDLRPYLWHRNDDEETFMNSFFKKLKNGPNAEQSPSDERKEQPASTSLVHLKPSHGSCTECHHEDGGKQALFVECPPADSLTLVANLVWLGKTFRVIHCDCWKTIDKERKGKRAWLSDVCSFCACICSTCGGSKEAQVRKYERYGAPEQNQKNQKGEGKASDSFLSKTRYFLASTNTNRWFLVSLLCVLIPSSLQNASNVFFCSAALSTFSIGQFLLRKHL